MTVYVYSTLATNQIYVNYAKQAKNEASAASRVDQVLIKGGANIAMPGFNSTQTVPGVLTEITDDQFEMLKNHPCFKKHVDNGFVTAVDSKAVLEVVTKDMEAKDDSAQAVADDFEEGGRLFAGGDTHAPASIGAVETNDKE